MSEAVFKRVDQGARRQILGEHVPIHSEEKLSLEFSQSKKTVKFNLQPLQNKGNARLVLPLKRKRQKDAKGQKPKKNKSIITVDESETAPDEDELDNPSLKTTGERNIVWASQDNINLDYYDFKRFFKGNWFNDNIINFYASLCCETQEYTYIDSLLYKQGKLGKKENELTKFKKIFIPIHMGIHWVFVVLSKMDEGYKCEYYDSLIQDHEELAIVEMNKLGQLMARKAINFNRCVIYKENEIRQQQNGDDCGVFVCGFMKYLAQEKTPDFDQGDMDDFRESICWEVFNKKLID